MENALQTIVAVPRIAPDDSAQSASSSKVVVRDLAAPVPGARVPMGGLTIAHVSDLHLRTWNAVTERTAQLLGELDYDVLVVTGDFGHRHYRWHEAATLACRVFANVPRHVPRLAVLGNHDHSALADEGLLPFRFLRNASHFETVRDSSVWFGGIEQSFPGDGDITLALKSQPFDGIPRIFLAHYPSAVFHLPSGAAHLVLAGHTHAGQIRLPRLGCLWPNDRIPRRFAWGLTRVLDTWLHVSAGIGTSTFLKVRMNCPPEITLLRITNG